MLKGLFSAIVTPFKEDGIDQDAFQHLIENQISQGISGLVVCGTTGESVTLTSQEYEQAIKLCVQFADKKVPVIAGTGTNDTNKTIKNTLLAQSLGADAALIVTPYYNKPTQEGLYQHYLAIHEATNLDIILYNVPSRTAVNLEIETIRKLSLLPRIKAIKDATSDIMRPLKIKSVVSKDFCVLSGEDASLLAFLAHGGDGCISVTANIAPKLCSDLYKAWQEGDLKTAFELRDKLLSLNEVMFIETNPCPVKYGVSLQGFGSEKTRLPLVEVSLPSKEKIKQAMQTAGVL